MSITSWIDPLSFTLAVVPVLLRVSLVVMLCESAWKHWKHKEKLFKILAAVEAAASLCIIAGAYTRFAAVVAFATLVAGLVSPRVRIFPQSTVILALVMSICLMVTGAGVFLAFDLPL